MGLRRGVVVGYGLLVAAMALVTVDVLADGPLRQLDFALHRLCARHVRGVWWEVANAVTQLGQRGVLLQAIVPLAVVAAIRRRSPRPPLAAALIIVVLSCLQVTLKAQIPRTFPFGDTDVIFAQGNAYPSGHTLNAILLVWVILELLALALPAAAARRLPPRRRRALALASGALAAVALVLADDHWLTDVLFSLALGPLLLNLLVRLSPFTGRERPGERPSPSADAVGSTSG
ncbi:phosphatase PAP2 family protein [Actinomadura namibiensis]|uniref:Membrane-associated phospholipid phosphatase n=1 Tax=Actinomadura namibiensis TaxID=182080 RepID=A0A7W3LT81_ACTNM|nr:phosphatase PAP2 family protein [Actinomadura namibiensis]MBA8953868.1 membrane-associated phospholipid phosphatase [Actinomadura namibiensis]